MTDTETTGEMSMKVAFLGLGTMGHHMARNVLRADHELTVWNRSAGRTESLAQRGAAVAGSPAEAAASADVICLSLSTSDVVEEVVTGEAGVLSGAVPGAVVIDFSTISPTTSRALAAACSQRGVQFLDAPVSGGPEGAEAGSLTIMVGGEDGAFARAEPVFQAVGESVRHVGPAGAGLSIKLINQMLVGVNLSAVLEAWVMANDAGIDLDVMFDLLKSSAGSSVMFTRNVPNFLMKQNYEPGFALKHLVKDLDLVMQMGRELNASLFTPAVALQLFRRGMADGYAEKDMAAAVLPMITRERTKNEDEV